jgi:hypothetical protein
VTLETEVKAFEAGDDSRVDSPAELLIPKSIIPEPLILEPIIPEHVSTCTIHGPPPRMLLLEVRE